MRNWIFFISTEGNLALKLFNRRPRSCCDSRLYKVELLTFTESTPFSKETAFVIEACFSPIICGHAARIKSGRSRCIAPIFPRTFGSRSFSCLFVRLDPSPLAIIASPKNSVSTRPQYMNPRSKSQDQKRKVLSPIAIRK